MRPPDYRYSLGDEMVNIRPTHLLGSVLFTLLMFTIPLNQTNARTWKNEMYIFDKIEDVEKLSFQRMNKSFVENIEIEDNIFLSEEWTLEAIEQFYSDNFGSCLSSKVEGENSITCFREIRNDAGKFRLIVTYQSDPSRNEIAIRGYVAIRTK